MIEWLATSHFSFLEGPSSPEALVQEAARLGYAGLGIADRMSVSGAPQGLQAVTELREAEPDKHGAFFSAPGIRLHFDQADPLFVYPLHRGAHARLCRFLSDWALAGMNREKGITTLPWTEFRDFLRRIVRESPESEHALARDFVIISVSGRFYPWVVTPKTGEKARLRTQDARAPTPSFSVPPMTPGQTPFWLLELAEICGRGEASALSLAYPLTLGPGVEQLQDWLEEHSARLRIPLLASSLPLFARPEDQDLCDLVTAIRHTRPVTQLGYLRQANGERRLLSPAEREAARRHCEERRRKNGLAWNDPFARSLALAERHHFSLLELRYRYPRERLPAGESAPDYLRRLAFEGAEGRYPEGLPAEVRAQLERELELVGKLEYEDYFLTIWDILRYAREQKILFQGRGSAANSTLCYSLGITAIDPVRMNLLFERFLSLERREPPDIDVDFEHERREEVLQEVYRRYGREHAAMISTYICFRGRMAARETAKALGLSSACMDDLAIFMGRESLSRLSADPPPPDLAAILKKHAVPPALWRRFLDLAQRLRGVPRHLSIHTGGFVLSSELLTEQVPLEPARLTDRSVVPWDKNDVDFLGWMKVDLLSLGMLTAIRKSFELIGARNPTRAPMTLATVPPECPVVYRALQRADTVGVFQIESRAQMNMLPRLAPKCFYDLVVEVAIVRPGPLQGGMVHPYLRRRQGLDPITYDHPDLEPILKKTAGVPIFQEQVMKIAVAVAGFSAGEADILRKVMSSAWRAAKQRMEVIQKRLFEGMAAKGIRHELAERLYKQIEGFGEYGFPESHAASFALLTYVSSWLKIHRPAEFLCALLNSQPMGFYSPRSLIGDAERHGVRVLPADVRYSRWDHTIEAGTADDRVPAVRLGLRLIEGLNKAAAARIEAFQREGFLTPATPTPEPVALVRRGLDARAVDKLVRAHAFRSDEKRSDPRREQLWNLLRTRKEGIAAPTLDLRHAASVASPPLEPFDEWLALMKDHETVGVTPGKHAATFARERFFRGQHSWRTAEDLYRMRNFERGFIVGLLTIKQRPPTAGGLTFLTLEDETGFMNLVIYAEVYEECRLTIESSRLLAAEGYIQRSLQLDPSDPHTVAVSFQVERLWNPFLAQKEAPGELRFKPRHYH